MILKPITSEKAVRMLDMENVLLFEIPRRERKELIKKAVEETFGVKVDKIRTLIRQNKKFAYVRLTKDNLAIDIATKLGMI
ncbi:MAG: 50S ribosomal protein L23 [Candidatus Pacearchaeota archaeon]|nr:50S ribosomal protein L23 [Candidatus Pacearchaeota archaeon]MDZ4226810.1 50S ribosomal protein L23 [Candidatus Pacearchaeota archaeon]